VMMLMSQLLLLLANMAASIQFPGGFVSPVAISSPPLATLLIGGCCYACNMLKIKID
jgi:hypothetical protein